MNARNNAFGVALNAALDRIRLWWEVAMNLGLSIEVRLAAMILASAGLLWVHAFARDLGLIG